MKKIPPPALLLSHGECPWLYYDTGGVDASLLWHGGMAAALLSAFDPLFGSVHLACVKKEVFMNAI